MGDAKAYVGICHSGNVLCQSHSFTSVGIVGNCLAEVLCDQLDGFQVQNVGKLPCSGCGIAFDGVGQSVHTCGSGQALGHGGHHIGIYDGDVGDIVRVYADELSLLLDVGNDIVDGGFCTCAAGGGNCDGEDSPLGGGSDTFQRADIRELGVVDDDADALAGVHGGAAADGDHHVSAGFLVGFHAVLDVLDGGVGLDVGIEGVGNAVLFQKICDIGCNTELDKVGIGCNEGLLEASCLDETGDLLDGAVAVIGNAVKDKTINCHTVYLLCLYIVEQSLSDFVIYYNKAGGQNKVPLLQNKVSPIAENRLNPRKLHNK